MLCHTSFQRVSTLRTRHATQNTGHTFRSVQLPQHRAGEFVIPKKQDIERPIWRQTRQAPPLGIVPRAVDEFRSTSRPEPRRHWRPGLTAYYVGNGCDACLPRDVTHSTSEMIEGGHAF